MLLHQTPDSVSSPFLAGSRRFSLVQRGSALRLWRTRLILISLCCGLAWAQPARAELPPPAKRKVDFRKDVEPLFRSHCIRCHGAARVEAGFRLDRRDDALNGGDSGPAFIVKKSDESLLIKLVAGVDPDVLMPPEGDKLSDEQIGILRAWIDQGADWPKE